MTKPDYFESDVWMSPEEWQDYLDGHPKWEDNVRVVATVAATTGWCIYDQLLARKFWPESAA
jgi:hypothetical protein